MYILSLSHYTYMIYYISLICIDYIDVIENEKVWPNFGAHSIIVVVVVVMVVPQRSIINCPSYSSLCCIALIATGAAKASTNYYRRQN
jgi:hypothetical protein